MPMLPSGIDPFSALGLLFASTGFRMSGGTVDRLPVSFSDCGRIMRDIALGVLCGATTGLFAAAVGDWL